MILVRMDEKSKCTIGLIYTEQLNFVCYCLERPGPSSDIANSELRILPGKYLLRIVNNRILLNNVPGRSGIFIHTGNRVEESRGCLLPGLTRTQQKDFSWRVNHSVQAMNELCKVVQSGDEILEIIDIG